MLIGPSGCGKTTTLRMINRLIEPTAGTISIEGVDIRSRPATELRRGIGYVIQQIGLFPHRTIAQNIATVPKMLGWDRGPHPGTGSTSSPSSSGSTPSLLGRYPAELSGGQQQRVGVARALAADPPVLLMDEPFGAVDPIVRARLQVELANLQERVRKTIVLVTHDIDEAITVGDRIAILNVGGVLEQYGQPDDLLAHPANEFVEAFLGAERSLKRLTLAKVADLDLRGGPVVAADASPAEAREVMDREAVELDRRDPRRAVPRLGATRGAQRPAHRRRDRRRAARRAGAAREHAARGPRGDHDLDARRPRWSPTASASVGSSPSSASARAWARERCRCLRPRGSRHGRRRPRRRGCGGASRGRRRRVITWSVVVARDRRVRRCGRRRRSTGSARTRRRQPDHALGVAVPAGQHAGRAA